MTFISAEFYILLLFVVIAYFAIPLKYRWTALLMGSLVFYIFQGIEMLPMLLAATAVGWLSGLGIGRVYSDEGQGAQEAKKKAKLVSGIGIIILIAVLTLVKCTRYMPESMAAKIIVPLGISYYTFSIISYLIDIYRRKYQPEMNALKFLLFTAFFPKILQGPIARYDKLANQLYEGHRFDYRRTCFGLQLFLWGLIKKLVIADRLAIFTGNVFGDIPRMSGSMLLVAAIFATVELYCDFSGCMDMAFGVSQIFGVELEQNFKRPFFSKSAAEFWRRWHITLGAWFKDYVYMPVVTSPRMAKILQWAKKQFGARVGKSLMAVIPLAIVWILTGVWHGTGKAYVVWGVYWGAMIIASQIWAPEIKKLSQFLHINTEAESFQIFRMVRTFGLFCIGRIITIPNNLHMTLQIFRKIAFEFKPWELVDETIYTYGLDWKDFSLLMCMFVLLWAVSMLQEKGGLRTRIAGYNLGFRWAIYYIAIIALIIFGIYGPGYDASNFVYMGF